MRRPPLFALCLTGLIALSACGSRKELKPLADQSLPPAPYGSVATPTAAELLTPPVEARPTRSDEALTESKDRESDEFDLPPSH